MGPSPFLIVLTLFAAFAAGLILRSLWPRTPGALLWMAAIVLTFGGMLLLWGLLGRPVPLVQHPRWGSAEVELVTPQGQWSMWAYRPMMISWLAILGIAIVSAILWSKRPKLKFGPGTSLALMGLVGLFIFFVVGLFALYAFIGVRSQHVILGDDIAVSSPRVVHIEDHPQYGSDSSPMPVVPPRGKIDMGQLVESNARQRTPQQSLDEVWSQIYAPRIKLDGIMSSETAAPSSPREMTDAARLILSASLPGADPFTQGWLVNAAKAIVGTAPSGQATSQTPPDWVSNPQNVVGAAGSTDSTQMKYVRRVVSTDALKTLEECRDQLEKRLRYAVGEQVRALARQATGGSYVSGGPMLSELGVTPDYILRELCPEGTYVETVQGADGDMLRAHALLEFTPPKEQALLARWQTAMRAKGFGPEATGLAAVEPSTVEISASSGERPDWVVHPPKQVGNVHRFAVASGPFVTVEECQQELNRKMADIVLQRAIELAQAAPRLRYSGATLYDLNLSGDYIRRELCTDEFVDTMETSVGEMKQVYALMEFNESQDAMLMARLRSYARQEGLLVAVAIGGVLLCGVAAVFGLLKLDSWTRGYYTKRLFLGVPVAIIGLFFLAMLVLDS